jgi:hypothetical protein
MPKRELFQYPSPKMRHVCLILANAGSASFARLATISQCGMFLDASEDRTELF